MLSYYYFAAILAACFASFLASTVQSLPVTAFERQAPSDSSRFGYLSANFYKNDEQVFFQLSDGDDPLSFSPVNNNKPVLVNDQGSKAVRDPFIAWNPVDDKYWLIGNNQSLIALGIDKGGDFGKAFYANYSGIVVFDGLDNTLTNWSAPRLVDVAGPDSLHVFAPEAIWDPEKKTFLLYWTGAYQTATTQKTYAAYTTDFVTFSDPFVYYEEDRNVVDMTIASVDDGRKNFVRFWQSQEFGGSVRGQYTKEGLLGNWYNINSTQTPGDNIGVLNPDKGGSGITVYRDNQQEKTFYLLVNEDAAEVPYQTDDIKVFPYKYANAPNFPRGTSQGTVVNLRKFQYDAIQSANWTGGYTDPPVAQQQQQQQQQGVPSQKFFSSLVPLFPHN